MITNEYNKMPYMKSLSSCLNRMVVDGYTEDFKVTDTGLKSLRTDKVYFPREVNVVNYFRFEGNSDPDDNAILYIIETNDGSKGTLVDAAQKAYELALKSDAPLTIDIRQLIVNQKASLKTSHDLIKKYRDMHVAAH